MEKNMQDVMRAKVNMETSRIAWRELQKFFASGAAVEVSAQLDLVDVALKMHEDDKTQFATWMKQGLVGKVSDQQAQCWLDANAEVWAVVVSPWVLVQEIRLSPTH